MSEYIKREDLMERVGRWQLNTREAIAEMIMSVPSADVVSREDYEGLELVCKNYEEALKDAVDELTMTEWISVKDRLPSEAGEYLVAYKLFDSDLAWRNEVLSFSTDLYKVDKFYFPRKKYKGKSGFYFYDSEYGYWEDSRVTHWMPLPKPPKENEDD